MKVLLVVNGEETELDNIEVFEMAKVLGQRADEKVGYYIKNDNNISFELQQNLVILRDLAQTMARYGELDLAKQFGDALESYYDELQVGGNGRSTR